jgi:hypothetical protein
VFEFSLYFRFETNMNFKGNENNNQEPPSYFDVISQIKAAKRDAKNPLDLTQKSISILCQSGI